MHPENSRNYLVPYDERNANRAKKLRCRYCGQRSFDSLTICPNCGRTLRAAASRWITWGIPLALAAFLILSLWGVSGRSPLAWATAISQGLGNFAASLGAQIEPRLTAPESVLTQVPSTQSQGASIQTNSAQASESQVPILTPVSIQEPVAQSNSQPATELEVAVNAPQSSPAQSSPADNANESAVEVVDAIDSTSTPVSLSQVSQTTSAEPEPTNTPTAEPTATTVPTTIATTAATATPTDTPEPKPTIAPTPAPEYRAEAVKLQLPAPGTVLDCSEENRITWQAPLSLVATDRFLLNLGYISSQDKDKYVVTWIAKPKFSIDETSWVLDPAYCKLSSDDFNNQWVWTMQVIDENNNVVSKPSRTSYFVWQKPL